MDCLVAGAAVVAGALAARTAVLDAIAAVAVAADTVHMAAPTAGLAAGSHKEEGDAPSEAGLVDVVAGRSRIVACAAAHLALAVDADAAAGRRVVQMLQEERAGYAPSAVAVSLCQTAQLPQLPLLLRCAHRCAAFGAEVGSGRQGWAPKRA